MAKTKYVVELVIESEIKLTKKELEERVLKSVSDLQMGIAPNTTPILPDKVRIRSIDFD